jgi:hypothetical protein
MNPEGQTEAHALEGSELINIRGDEESGLRERDWHGRSTDAN